jgi:hypothetical protein
MENIFLEEYLKKINSILSWFNELSKKLDFKYWLDLITLSQIYYNNKLEDITNIHISLESKYFNTLISYLIQNKIQFKWPKYLFTKVNYLQYNEISSYIEIEELIIYFWKKENNNLINEKSGLKIPYDIIYELKRIIYNEDEYSIPNNIEKYLELINLLKIENNLEIKKLNYKLDNKFFEKKNYENKNNKSNLFDLKDKNIKEIPLIETKVETKVDKILKKRKNYWEKYEKSLLNEREIEESKMVKNIDRKNNTIPKFFSL